jgi:hypothetical protein
MNSAGYSFLYSGIIGALSILFWFLYLQNRRQKNLLFISISTSLWFIWPLFSIVEIYLPDMDFNQWWLIAFIAYEWWPLAIASMVYTAGEIFNFKYKKALATFAILFVVYCVFSFYFSVIDIGDKPIPFIITILLLYIVVSSWKKLKGAQWAVAAGIVLTAIFSGLSSYITGWLYTSVWFLSLPA